MLGVATLIIVVNVMSGFMDNLRDKLLGTNSDITITRFDVKPIAEYAEIMDNVSMVDGVGAVAPFTYSQVMLSSERTVSGAIVRGIDPALEKHVSKLESFVTQGSMDNISTTHNGMPTILLGRELALSLNVFVGDVVTIISPQGAKGPFGTVPKMKKFAVAGYFDTGIAEYNSSFAYISIESAQSFFKLGDTVSGLNVAVADDADIEDVSLALSESLPYPYWARDWMSMNKGLFSALQLERLALFIILTLIIVVASFNIISMISITVKDKQKDIAILRAYGASSKFVMSVFVRQGLLVGLAGTILGNVFALAITLLLRHTSIIKIPENIYFTDRVPIDLDFGVYILVTVCALLITFLASIFPSRQASKMPPIVALRND